MKLGGLGANLGGENWERLKLKNEIRLEYDK